MIDERQGLAPKDTEIDEGWDELSSAPPPVASSEALPREPLRAPRLPADLAPPPVFRLEAPPPPIPPPSSSLSPGPRSIPPEVSGIDEAWEAEDVEAVPIVSGAAPGAQHEPVRRGPHRARRDKKAHELSPEEERQRPLRPAPSQGLSAAKVRRLLERRARAEAKERRAQERAQRASEPASPQKPKERTQAEQKKQAAVSAAPAPAKAQANKKKRKKKARTASTPEPVQTTPRTSQKKRAARPVARRDVRRPDPDITERNDDERDSTPPVQRKLGADEATDWKTVRKTLLGIAVIAAIAAAMLWLTIR
jgi:hypothetical protein